jgi:hypothetical protein
MEENFFEITEFNSAFSVYIDNNKFKKEKENKNNSFNLSEKKNDTSNNIDNVINNIYPKYIDKWVDSSVVLNCQLCKCKFGYFTGKHHCRACGCVFCTSCCNQYIKIPEFIKKPTEDKTYRQQLVNLCKHGKISDCLVCKECFSKVKNLENIIFNLNIAEFLDLKSLNIILRVNKKWHNASIHYLSKFRDIQYIKIEKLYDSWETNILYDTSQILNTHSNWKIHVAKMQLQLYFNNKISNFIIDDKKNKKRICCWSLMCSRKCNLNIDLIDFIEILKIVNILNYKKNILWDDAKLKKYILHMLHEISTSANDANLIVIKRIIPLLCSTLSELLNECIEIIDINFIKKILDEFLVYPDTVLLLYDEILYLKSLEDKSMGIINLYDIIKEYLNKDIFSYEKQENIAIMINTIVNITEKITDKIFLPILYPLDYNWKIIKINNYSIMKSNSAPILLDVDIINNNNLKKKVKFLIKKENTLRKEQIVSCIIYLLLFKLKQHESNSNKYFENIPSYDIKMLTKNVGVIEFVENSITLREINDKGYTIQNYILENNKEEILDVLKKRFMSSLSISCCLSYLLGLGDRHLDNIMINKRGQIFNIDYGYLLENPKSNILGAPNIKVTSDMIDFLGGTNGEYYKQFKIHLIHVHDIMRLQKNIISSHYELIGNEKYLDWNLYKDKLENRFMSGLVAKDIQIVLTNEIESSGSVSSTFNDTCHYISMWWNTSS